MHVLAAWRACEHTPGLCMLLLVWARNEVELRQAGLSLARAICKLARAHALVTAVSAPAPGYGWWQRADRREPRRRPPQLLRASSNARR